MLDERPEVGVTLEPELIDCFAHLQDLIEMLRWNFMIVGHMTKMSMILFMPGSPRYSTLQASVYYALYVVSAEGVLQQKFYF